MCTRRFAKNNQIRGTCQNNEKSNGKVYNNVFIDPRGSVHSVCCAERTPYGHSTSRPHVPRASVYIVLYIRPVLFVPFELYCFLISTTWSLHSSWPSLSPPPRDHFLPRQSCGQGGKAKKNTPVPHTHPRRARNTRERIMFKTGTGRIGASAAQGHMRRDASGERGLVRPGPALPPNRSRRSVSASTCSRAGTSVLPASYTVERVYSRCPSDNISNLIRSGRLDSWMNTGAWLISIFYVILAAGIRMGYLQGWAS